MARREDAAALMDGRYRLAWRNPVLGGAGRYGGLSFETFNEARVVAQRMVRANSDVTVFIEQCGKHVWASDGTPCPCEPRDF